MTENYKPLVMPPTAYAVTHCQKCEAGWTRIGKDSRTVTVCLLDREQIWAEITDCSRFEPKDDPA